MPLPLNRRHCLVLTGMQALPLLQPLQRGLAALVRNNAGTAIGTALGASLAARPATASATAATAVTTTTANTPLTGLPEALPAALQAALRAYAGNEPLREGRITLDIAPLVDNGNTVPVTVSVESAMTEAEHVRGIALFAGRNPLPDVAQFTLSPRMARAVVSTRMRLATTQQVVAVARMSDGRCYATRVEVLVTLAACIES
jgi:sulfur-oxidizing protein SoxY